MINLYGFLFITIFGVLSHFIYDWSNHNKYALVFFATNESVWEHLKLVVFPSLVWILIELPFNYNNPNFILAKFVSLFVAILMITFLHYLYIYFFKKHNSIYSICIFVFSIALGQFLSYLILKSNYHNTFLNYLSLIGLIFIYIIFLISTLIPGKWDIFKDKTKK